MLPCIHTSHGTTKKTKKTKGQVPETEYKEEEWKPKVLMKYQIYAADFYMRQTGDQLQPQPDQVAEMLGQQQDESPP